MTAKHPDDEIDTIIWSEIESSDSKGDFICYVIHSPANAKFLENAKQRIDTEPDPDSLVPAKYPNAIRRIEELARKNDAVASFHMGKIHALGIAVPQNLPEGTKKLSSWVNRERMPISDGFINPAMASPKIRKKLSNCFPMPQNMVSCRQRPLLA